MDIVTSIPVRLIDSERATLLLKQVRERIARRAYENFIERGGLDGRDVDDWLNAERELIVKPAARVQSEGEDIFVEVILPEIALPNLAVHIAPSHLLISSDADEDGLQLCQVIDLPLAISMDGVDAEQWDNMLRITAAVSNSQPQFA